MLNLTSVKDDKIFAADLFVTNKCNLKCKYCFHKQDGETLTVEKGKRIMDLLKASDKIGEKFVINFFGGEPLLYPEIVRELIEYGRMTWRDRNLRFFISTNGTYWNEDFYKFLRDTKTQLQISVDGTWDNQENNRGHATEVLGNIKKICEIMPATGRLTYAPDAIKDLSLNCEFLYGLGIRDFMHHNVMEIPWTEENFTDYTREFWKLMQLREKYKDLKVHFIEYPLSILQGKEAPTDEHCGAGKGLIAIQTDGSIYCCHRGASNRIYCLGNIEEGYNRGIFRSIRKSSVEKCSKCAANKICHSCMLCSQLINGAFSEPVEWQCRIVAIEYQILSQVAERMSLTNINSTIAYTAETVYQCAKLLNSVNQRLKNLEARQ